MGVKSEIPSNSDQNAMSKSTSVHRGVRRSWKSRSAENPAKCSQGFRNDAQILPESWVNGSNHEKVLEKRKQLPAVLSASRYLSTVFGPSSDINTSAQLLSCTSLLRVQSSYSFWFLKPLMSTDGPLNAVRSFCTCVCRSFGRLFPSIWGYASCPCSTAVWLDQLEFCFLLNMSTDLPCFSRQKHALLHIAHCRTGIAAFFSFNYA